MGGGQSKTTTTNDVEDEIQFKTFKDLVNHENVTDIYYKGKELGSGNMATVYQYKHKESGKDYAAKVVVKSSLDKLTDFTNELEILGHVKGHEHILELEDVFEDENNYYLITDLVSGGELFDRICNIGVYTEQIAKDMCLPILEAIQYCHRNHIVHRDIKPENLLLLDSSAGSPLKIADFGVATWVHNLKKEKYPKCGTPEYMAPEMYTAKKYDLKVDVWAMGCVVFIMLCGWHPFQDTQDIANQTEAIKSGDLDELDDEQISDLAKDFIRRMLEVDPERRWSLEQLMKHEWLATSTGKKINLKKQQEKIKKYLANRRFRKVAFAVIAVNRARFLTRNRAAKSRVKDEPASATPSTTAAAADDLEEDKQIADNVVSLGR